MEMEITHPVAPPTPLKRGIMHIPSLRATSPGMRGFRDLKRGNTKSKDALVTMKKGAWETSAFFIQVKRQTSNVKR